MSKRKLDQTNIGQDFQQQRALHRQASVVAHRIYDVVETRNLPATLRQPDTYQPPDRPCRIWQSAIDPSVAAKHRRQVRNRIQKMIGPIQSFSIHSGGLDWTQIVKELFYAYDYLALEGNLSRLFLENQVTLRVQIHEEPRPAAAAAAAIHHPFALRIHPLRLLQVDEDLPNVLHGIRCEDWLDVVQLALEEQLAALIAHTLCRSSEQSFTDVKAGLLQNLFGHSLSNHPSNLDSIPNHVVALLSNRPQVDTESKVKSKPSSNKEPDQSTLFYAAAASSSSSSSSSTPHAATATVPRSRAVDAVKPLLQLLQIGRTPAETRAMYEQRVKNSVEQFIAGCNDRNLRLSKMAQAYGQVFQACISKNDLPILYIICKHMSETNRHFGPYRVNAYYFSKGKLTDMETPPEMLILSHAFGIPMDKDEVSVGRMFWSVTRAIFQSDSFIKFDNGGASYPGHALSYLARTLPVQHGWGDRPTAYMLENWKWACSRNSPLGAWIHRAGPSLYDSPQDQNRIQLPEGVHFEFLEILVDAMFSAAWMPVRILEVILHCCPPRAGEVRTKPLLTDAASVFQKLGWQYHISTTEKLRRAWEFYAPDMSKTQLSADHRALGAIVRDETELPPDLSEIALSYAFDMDEPNTSTQVNRKPWVKLMHMATSTGGIPASFTLAAAPSADASQSSSSSRSSLAVLQDQLEVVRREVASAKNQLLRRKAQHKEISILKEIADIQSLYSGRQNA